ncbi:MAG: nuclear transport factor 2 family protein [bacterium]
MNDTSKSAESGGLVRLSPGQEIGPLAMEVFQVLRRVADAVQRHDADALLAEFALDDPRFNVFEALTPYRMDAVDIKGTADVLTALRNPDMRFEDVRLDCADKVAVVTGYQVLSAGAEEKRRRYSSRFSIVLVPLPTEWKILHAHFSSVPGTK